MADRSAPLQHIQELARLYFRLGLTSFGGPAAHIAMMEDQVVVRRKWMLRESFLDLIGATNLIPGPNSTEMAIHVGFMRGGTLGLAVAGACFILPSAIITGVVAWFYREYGTVPQVGPFLEGIKPAVIAVIAAAAFRLGKTATFIGYQILGLPGAIAATIAIFLPSFIFVAIVNPLIPKLRRSGLSTAFLDAVNASSIALIAAAAAEIAVTSLNNRFPVLIFVVAAALAFKWKVNSAWLVIGGGIIGLAGSLVR